MITKRLVKNPQQTTRYQVFMFGSGVVAEPLIHRNGISQISMGWIAPIPGEPLDFSVVLRPSDALFVRYEGMATIVVEDLTGESL